MRKILLSSLMLMVAAAHGQEVLLTPSFTVTIVGCAEGNVSCDDAKYTGVSKRTGATLKLTGKTLHTMGADGVTPSRFLGWQFRNGATMYTVTEGGVLEVRQGAKTLFSEQGEWKNR
jgi:hypothetical protein